MRSCFFAFVKRGRAGCFEEEMKGKKWKRRTGSMEKKERNEWLRLILDFWALVENVRNEG